MTMHTAYLKEHDGVANNTIGQLSSDQAMPWWGVDSAAEESYRQYRSTESANGKNQPGGTEHQQLKSTQGIGKANVTDFPVALGDGQKTQQLQAVMSVQPTLPDYQAHFELGFGQPMIYAKNSHVSPSFGILSTYGPQYAGRIMLPLSLTANDGPIYVNAKQYHGIIRRRKLRAKAELQNKAARIRKPYMHKSRHLHAMRRPRGSGGRFLNTQNNNPAKGGNDIMKNLDGQFSQPTKKGDGRLSQSTGSQNSEVLQSDSGTLNSQKDGNDHSISNFSGSEVTSMYSMGHPYFYATNRLMPSDDSHFSTMDNGHGNMKPTKWVFNI